MPKVPATARITSKGQLTVPKEVRVKLGIGPGDELEFVEDSGALYIRKKIGHSPFARYVGYLRETEGQDSDVILRDLRGHEDD